MTKNYRLADHMKVYIEHIHKNPNLYMDVYQTIFRMGLIPFMTFDRPFNEELVL